MVLERLCRIVFFGGESSSYPSRKSISTIRRQTEELDPTVRSALVRHFWRGSENNNNDDVAVEAAAAAKAAATSGANDNGNGGSSGGIINASYSSYHASSSSSSSSSSTSAAPATVVDETTLLQEIEQELAEARSCLKEAIEKEQFLDMRCRQYRKALQNKRHRLSLLVKNKEHQRRGSISKITGSHSDVEGQALMSAGVMDQQRNLTRRTRSDDLVHENDEAGQEKIPPVAVSGSSLDERQLELERDEAALDRIVSVQLGILTNCEEVRRRIESLEAKRSKALFLKKECDAFLEAAAKAGAEESIPDRRRVDDEVEMAGR